MRMLVADTNVIFLFSKNPGFVALAEKLRKSGIKLLVPQFCLDELLSIKVKGDIMKYAGFSEKEFEQFVEEISPDKKDAPFFALSLAFDKAPIWSREPRLKRQKIVKVLDDKGVEELLKMG